MYTKLFKVLYCCRIVVVIAPTKDDKSCVYHHFHLGCISQNVFCVSINTLENTHVYIVLIYLNVTQNIYQYKNYGSS